MLVVSAIAADDHYDDPTMIEHSDVRRRQSVADRRDLQKAPKDPFFEQLKPFIAPTKNDLKLFTKMNSPQAKAYAWLKADKLANGSQRTLAMDVERYALAVFYFAGGKVASEYFIFLTSDSVCTWDSVTCSDDGSTVIEFGGIGVNNVVPQPILPWEMALLSNLEYVDFEDQGWYGTIPLKFTQLTKLTHLNLGINFLKGKIPAALGTMTQLTYLGLDDNLLTGAIPATLGSLTRLTDLQLRDNKLVGPLPATLGNLSQLTSLTLNDNPLKAKIPDSLGNLALLEGLELRNCQLVGTIPSSLAKLSNLGGLDVSNNKLTGPIPTNFAQLTNLRAFYVDRNKLTGVIPAGIGTFVAFQGTYLSFSCNDFTGSVEAYCDEVKDISPGIEGFSYLTIDCPEVSCSCNPKLCKCEEYACNIAL